MCLFHCPRIVRRRPEWSGRQKRLKKIGKNFNVLFDKKEGDFLIGRTEFDSPEVDNEVLVKLKHNDYARLGDFANVKITDANDFDLFGELI